MRRLYNSPKQMQKIIDKYMDSCGPQFLTDDEGNAVVVNGKPVQTGYRVPTVTGLALALGFTSRQALLNYQAKPEYFDTVTRAKSRIEEYVEGRLFDKDGVQGAKFALKNNFKGWSETGEQNPVDVSAIQAFLIATKPTDTEVSELFEDDGSEEQQED